MARQAAGVGLLAVALGACSQWDVRPGPTPDVFAGVGERRVRVTLADGRRIALHTPRVVGDSVIGFEAARGGGERRAVALADVARVETQELDGHNTLSVAALVVLGIAVAWAGLVMLIGATEHT